MKMIKVKPIFNFFLFNKYNFGLWKMPISKIDFIPKFSGSNWKTHAEYGIIWFNFLLEISYTKKYENCN